MLTELSIRDFAIIDHISITFKEGLTVLTGETGAGKSIIIDAIQLLSGGRGSVEFVRHGAKKAEIEGLFTVEADHPIHSKTEQFGVDISEDGMVVLNRAITHQGKSICRVNGKLVTLGILKEFGRALIDIHSQHETQSLMDPERHIELLDLFASSEMKSSMQEYRRVYEKYRTLVNRYKELSENEQEMAQRLDLLEFQLHELQEAELQPKEDEELSEERTKLNNYEKIYQGIHDAYYSLYGEQKGLDWLSHAMTSLESTGDFDDSLAKMSEELSNSYYLIEELTFQLSSQMENLEFDPERLNQIESRLNELNRLKKKYGADVEEMLEYASRIEEEIDEIKNKDSRLANMESQIDELGQDAVLEAKDLHDIRKHVSELLAGYIHDELKDLYLEKAAFDVDISIKEGKQSDPVLDGKPVRLQSNGFDHVKFLITTNPGEPLREIHKVASGGEMSRIMLALKRIFSRHQGVTSVIFDEVDTGVSGRVAQAIAEKIYGISEGSQVLCISHLPQVAAMADTHVRIEKRVDNDRTYTGVSELSHQEKADELSRMITGAELTETTLEHARELLEMAHKHKLNK
ncbi:DNA repair protein RecN [Halobacillus halophilus]|uniref:DNA repair protein RecN n=1 Tax=Halobacillus halophilus (strain ATCC 35676 / DSM 2266 / JCM 20832 / KCTC 3685 / LMG 17431 / NBRC 102448 / NCIMB 2269) TaxID=866895 RepID=I0JNU2_HALH3|nr:DNA repair protein RecN [Halobacillus halophilus]ASF39858.1 DNA repair protein RecN [Halobacillus halophilus]CCG45812.1 DNA repair protein RecN [Halobacillus halophilus DSM 2266]